MIGCGSSSGEIALRNATQKAMPFSNSLVDTTPRVLSLHRDFLRSVPWIKRAYCIARPESVRTPRRRMIAPPCAPSFRPLQLRSCCGSSLQEMRAALTEAFRAKKNTSEIHTINRLIIQGRMELEETLMLWKGASHVSNWFDAAAAAKAKADVPKPEFLDDFFAGRPTA